MGGEASGGSDNFVEPGTAIPSQQKKQDTISQRQFQERQGNDRSRNGVVPNPDPTGTFIEPGTVTKRDVPAVEAINERDFEEGFLSRVARAAPPSILNPKANPFVNSMFTGISLIGGAALAPVTLLGTALNMLGAKPAVPDGTVTAPNDRATGGESRVIRQSATSAPQQLAQQATAQVQQNDGTMTRSTGNGNIRLGSATGYRRSLLGPVYRRSV